MTVYAHIYVLTLLRGLEAVITSGILGAVGDSKAEAGKIEMSLEHPPCGVRSKRALKRKKIKKDGGNLKDTEANIKTPFGQSWDNLRDKVHSDNTG